MVDGQEKQSAVSDSKEIGFSYEEQVKSDQFIALQGQVSQCLDERRGLIESRNLYIKLMIASWAITVFVVFIYPGIQESRLEKQDIRKQALRAAAQHTSSAPQRGCKPCADQTTEISPLASPKEYLQHLEKKLGKSKAVPAADLSPLVTQQTLPAESEQSEEKTTVPVLIEQIVKQTVFEWSIAWELQNSERYLSYYGKRFIPENGTTLYKWKNQRRDRVEKPTSIRIRIDDLIVTDFQNGQATVEFIQHYMTPNYKDVAHKRMIFVKEDKQWKIIREIVLG